MSFESKVKKFVKNLEKFNFDGAFNPWGQSDSQNDIGMEAVKIRQNQLEKYLLARENAKIILLAEGLSYQGGHFTGIAMTSERQLINSEKMYGREVYFDGEKKRTSNPDKATKQTIKDGGFTELTGSVVAKTMLEICDPFDWINWNCFAFHPYQKGNILSNRAPKKNELEMGVKYLQEFLSLFPEAKIISVGRISYQVASSLGVKSIQVRHPSYGGANIFKGQVKQILK